MSKFGNRWICCKTCRRPYSEAERAEKKAAFSKAQSEAQIRRHARKDGGLLHKDPRIKELKDQGFGRKRIARMTGLARGTVGKGITLLNKGEPGGLPNGRIKHARIV